LKACLSGHRVKPIAISLSSATRWNSSGNQFYGKAGIRLKIPLKWNENFSRGISTGWLFLQHQCWTYFERKKLLEVRKTFLRTFETINSLILHGKRFFIMFTDFQCYVYGYFFSPFYSNINENEKRYYKSWHKRNDNQTLNDKTQQRHGNSSNKLWWAIFVNRKHQKMLELLWCPKGVYRVFALQITNT
jgi:hypothetical protein